ncbi:MAG TPA: PHP domain-containing protein, partial [Actinomycetota bacterium]|nr:PHP domain-containing protein [Actinomycetota bacterium]
MGAALMSGLEDAPYAELHLHTCYSLLEGASSPKELIARAASHGYDALAITDRNNLYGAMVFARACRDAGIRSIIGVELTVAVDPDDDPDAGPDDVPPGSRHDLTLLAETRQGYANLCRLVSLANGWGLAEQADRERRRRDPCAALHHVREHTAGVVCLTGGRHGELAQRVAAGDRPGARDVL